MKTKIIKLLKVLKLHNLCVISKEKLTYISSKKIKHKKEMLKFYSQFIKKGDLCFDVGANQGNRTDIFLALGATVIAIEPQEACIKKLQKKYKNNTNVKFIQKALGEKEGQAELMMCDSSTLASLSTDWIKSIKDSGRFPTHNWDKKIIVPVTTLNNLIKKYGTPKFCKIDVEGFEYPVIKGLSTPIQIISFEFAPEFIESTIKAINYLSKMGKVRFNYSLSESMELTLPTWVKFEEMCDILNNLEDKSTFGDVYSKFID